MTSPMQTESLSLSTADGVTLEAQLTADPNPDRQQPRAVAVICHPHPLYGGSMHNNVVDRLFTLFPAAGVPAIRFNFRGVGRSEGSHGDGEAERADVVAAIDVLADRYPTVPIVVAGYSFGADVALSVGDERLAGWLVVSPPLRIVDPDSMVAGSDERPKVIVSGTADDFRPADQAEDVVVDWPATEVIAAPGVDHFWRSGLDQLDGAATTILDKFEAS